MAKKPRSAYGKLDDLVDPFYNKRPPKPSAPPSPPPAHVPGRSQLVRPPPMPGVGFGGVPRPKEPPKPPPEPINLDDDKSVGPGFRRRPPKTRLNRNLEDPRFKNQGRGTPASLKSLFEEFQRTWKEEQGDVAPTRLRSWEYAHGREVGSERSMLIDRKVVKLRENMGSGRGVSVTARGMGRKVLQDLAHLARRIWRKKAMSALRGRGTALNDYLRGMHVELKGERIHMWLEGWEAMSREYGWNPAGGMSGGIGEYTGQAVDLKKIMLNGAAYKVIPMRIEATSKDIARNVNRAARRGLLTHEAGPLTKAAGMEYAEQVFRAGGSYHPTDDTGDLPESPFGPGAGTRKGRGKRWEKSIFDDSLPVKPLGGGMKNSRAYVTFRTMSDPTKMKDKEKAARHRKKWITRGIPPANLIQEVKEELFSLIKTGSI